MKPSRTLIFTLLAAALAGIATTVYQWLALLALRSSGEKPLCAVNATLDCSAIWDSALSTSIHQFSGIPVAGWGLIWSALILILTVKLVLDSHKKRDSSLAISALRVTAIAGLIITVALVLYSISLQVFCLSCIMFYIIVGIVAGAVLTRLKSGKTKLVAGSGIVLALTVILALLLFSPGQRTPLQSVLNSSLGTPGDNINGVKRGNNVSNSAASQNDTLKQFIENQPQPVLQAMSNFLAQYRTAKTVEQRPDPGRLSFGSDDSPVKVVEWLEITCPHCAQLNQQLASIQNSTDAGSWSLETRYYPLDSECNPEMTRSRNNGVSCLAAKSLICLSADREKADSVRATLFANQKQLSTDMIRDIIRDHEVDMIKLAACIESDATRQTLATDITMAQDHNISGTPLVVMNGRPLTAMPHLIYSLILSAGNDAAPEFAILPEAEEISHDEHDH